MEQQRRTEPRVVIIGGGFGGLELAKRLARAPVQITLLDRSNHHLFQPLLYQVALAALSSADIAMPIRSILNRQKNARVLMCEVTRVDLQAKQVEIQLDAPIPYDYLAIAAGAANDTFGQPDWEARSFGLKSLDDAESIRQKILLSFEHAERECDPAAQRRLMTFVVIGAGPTGVELAGAIAELGRWVLARDFRNINPSQTRVVLVEAGERILPSFHGRLSEKAARQLQELGVELRCPGRVTEISEAGVSLGNELIPTGTVLWAAGIKAHPLARTLGVPLDRTDRILVQPDCSLPGFPNAFAIGDIVSFRSAPDHKPLPQVSPVAIQQAAAVARNILGDLRGKPRAPFTYRDKGSMATIGRKRAVAQVKGLRLSGLFAWVVWLLVHIWYLIGFRNRFVVMINWFWSYVTFQRGARLVTSSGRALSRSESPETSFAPRRTCQPQELNGSRDGTG